ncbi:FAD-dependent oxidoreductase, partial [candidate division KSB1 bacterium]|nr:FAD-dependent oxidoreductase [candidate division KSB1 bacterium]
MDTPILFETDVLVAGGGAAGICAAIAAARNGAKTALVERWPILGGQSTLARVNMWHTSDGKREVIFGLTQEFVQRLERYDAVERLPDFPHTHETYEFHPDLLALVYEEMVRESNIRCLCSTPCVDVVRANRRIQAVIVGTKLGLRAIKANIFIDATGDGDIGAFAGCQTRTGRESDSRCQGMTLTAAFKGLNRSKRAEIEADHHDLLQKMRERAIKAELPAFGPHWFGGDFIW